MGCKSISVKCECPTHIALKDLSVKPKRRTPLDRLGFPQRCCCCCSLRVASVFICLLSFASVQVWGGVELLCADRALALVFPDRGAAFKYCRLAYNVLTGVLLLLCGGLMLGIIIRKEQPILVYIWYALLYNLVSLAVIVGGVGGSVARQGGVASRHGVRAVLGVIWTVVFIYLLMVVNSYKLAVWYLTLGFGINTK